MEYREISLIAIGGSAGSIPALRTIISELGRDFRTAIAVVLHRHYDSSSNLERMLAKNAKIPVIEVEDGQDILPGRIFMAPPDYHLLTDANCFRLSGEDRENFARPSIDVLFESVALSHRSSSMGVILTGMGRDGAKGLAAIKNSGGIAIVQDPATAEADEMPKAAIAACSPDVTIIPFSEIAGFLMKITSKLQRMEDSLRNPISTASRKRP